eukprot:202265-Ditylum_brightwellii.AAC.1
MNDLTQTGFLTKILASNQLYAQHTNGFYVCHEFVPGSLSTFSPTKYQRSSPPDDAVFTPITCQQGHIICSGLINSFLDAAAENTLSAVTFAEYLTQLDSTLHCLFGNLVDQEIDAYFWLEALQAVAMSNFASAFPGDTAHTGSAFDLLQEIWTLKSDIHLTAKWIEAHQDTRYPGKELSEPARLNSIFDAYASSYMATSVIPLSTSPSLPSSLAMLIPHATDIEGYVKRKTSWTWQQINLVQWLTVNAAFTDLTLLNKISVLKFQHNWLQTGKCTKEFRPGKSSTCHVCTAAAEDWEHLFHCSHDLAFTS